MASRSWPLNKDLPERKCVATYAPYPGMDRYRHASARESWQLRAWREATGREHPEQFRGPLMEPGEVGRVLMALGRKKLEVYL